MVPEPSPTLPAGPAPEPVAPVPVPEPVPRPITPAQPTPTAPWGATPKGRPFSYHYGNDPWAGPARNLPGSLLDHVVDDYPPVPGKYLGTFVHYDPVNDVTVITGNNGVIVTARKGCP